MTNEQILQLETNRLNNLNNIYLIRDGNGWYKAYEWSAYLLEFYPKNISGRLLKVTKRKYSIGELVNVSLQTKSLDKYANEAMYNKEDQNDMIVVIVDLSLYQNTETPIDVTSYLNILQNWKSKIELAEVSKKSQKQQNDQSQRIYKSSEIEQKILGFQYYNLEKDDLIDFINQLKNMCASRI